MHRGGTGTAQLWVTHDVPTIFFTAISDNTKIQTPQPLFGGYAPCTLPGIGIRNADLAEKMKNGEPLELDIHEIIENRTIGGDWEVEFQGRDVRSYNRDDVITIGFSTGGAGYGDPLERDPAAVLQDVSRGFVSERVARDVYCVACDIEHGRVDDGKTAELRAEERRKRLVEGCPYDAFEVAWLKRRPREDILKYFGSWPDGKLERPVIRP
jgi:acetophenone carboxylase